MPATANVQTPGPAPVNASEWLDAAALLLVFGLLEFAEDDPVWFTLELEDWEPELGVGAGTKAIGTVTCGSVDDESPNASTQESPAAICAAVGGQGYFAASLAGAFPPLSELGHVTRSDPPQGGPGVGELMLNVVESVPAELTVTRPAAAIPLQLTGTDWLIGAGKATVG